jgi:hypothetical protein
MPKKSVERIQIKYGMFKMPYGFGRATYNSTTNKLHLLEFEAYNRSTICGTAIIGEPTSFATGTLCEKCAKELGITDADWFEIDEDERRMMGW